MRMRLRVIGLLRLPYTGIRSIGEAWVCAAAAALLL